MDGSEGLSKTERYRKQSCIQFARTVTKPAWSSVNTDSCISSGGACVLSQNVHVWDVTRALTVDDSNPRADYGHTSHLSSIGPAALSVTFGPASDGPVHKEQGRLPLHVHTLTH